jgi:spore germination protein KB
MMLETPIYMFNALTIVVASYTVRTGIDAMGRMFFLLLCIMMFAVLMVLIYTIPLAKWDMLLPLFPEGFKPVLHGTYFSPGFPFAELFMFAVILPFVRKESRRRAGKWMYRMTAFSGLVLLVVTVLTVITLGPLADARKFSLYAVARLLKIGDVLVGIEAIVGIAMMVGSFMKAAVVLFILNCVTVRFFGLNDDKLLLPAIAFIGFLLSITMIHTESEFVFSVDIVWPILVLTLGIIPLVLAALITFVKRRPGRG